MRRAMALHARSSEHAQRASEEIFSQMADYWRLPPSEEYPPQNFKRKGGARGRGGGRGRRSGNRIQEPNNFDNVPSLQRNLVQILRHEAQRYGNIMAGGMLVF